MIPEFRAGAAAIDVDPPLGLPMIGVVRRGEGAEGRIGTLEVTALAFERGSRRVVLCGVDTVGIQSPEVDSLRDSIAHETGAERAGVLLNWNHTHHAPAGGRSIYEILGGDDAGPRAAVHEYVDTLHGRIVEVCRQAFEALEPAWTRWGLGFVDEAINRRQRDADGMVRKIGWNPSGLIDSSVPVLQAVRRDGTSIATLVSYGCHTVTTGIGLLAYSPDYPGPLRALVREVTGGQCVFFQGAGGNVMPRIAFDDSGEESTRLGRRLAIEALHVLADGPSWPAGLAPAGFSSATPLDLFRWEPVDPEPPQLAAVEESVDFPLLPLPSLSEAKASLRQAETELRDAESQGADEPTLRVLRYHGINHWRRVVAELESDSPRTAASGPIGAVRIGDGAIVTGPGEIFTEIGLAVKERSPADVTLYAGYTNGAISYMPIAAEYPLGGYEPAYGNKSYGLPTQVSPETERILVETGVRLVRGLFPERPTIGVAGWLSSGARPKPPPQTRLTRPL
jgi:neutral ceramidase